MKKALVLICSFFWFVVVGSVYADGDYFNYFIPVFKPKPAHWSGLGITNLGVEDASVDIMVYDETGSLQTTESKAIVADGQASFLVGAGAAESGWIEIKSDQELAGLNFLGQYIGTTNHYYLADVPFFEHYYDMLMIPHVAQNDTWDTTVYVANPTLNNASVNFIYTAKDGSDSTPYVTTIPAKGSREISLSTIGNSNSLKGGYVTMTSDQFFIAFALYNNLKTGNVSFAGINAVDPWPKYLDIRAKGNIPLFKPQPGHWVGLGITNFGTSGSNKIYSRLHNQQGAEILSETKYIAAKGQDSFVVESGLFQDGSIEIAPMNDPIAGMCLLGQYKGTTTDYYLADVPFINEFGGEQLIPHVAQNDTWDTTLYIANPLDDTIRLDLTYTAKDGTDFPPYTSIISGNGSLSVSVADIARSNNIRGGYVTIKGDDSVAAFALYSNLKTGNHSFAGINAVNVWR